MVRARSHVVVIHPIYLFRSYFVFINIDDYPRAAVYKSRPDRAGRRRASRRRSRGATVERRGARREGRARGLLGARPRRRLCGHLATSPPRLANPDTGLRRTSPPRRPPGGRARAHVGARSISRTRSLGALTAVKSQVSSNLRSIHLHTASSLVRPDPRRPRRPRPGCRSGGTCTTHNPI